MTVPYNYTFFEFARAKNLDNETLEKIEEYVLQRIEKEEDDYDEDLDNLRDEMWNAEMERDDAFDDKSGDAIFLTESQLMIKSNMGRKKEERSSGTFVYEDDVNQNSNMK